jgi:uncharacterized protein YjbI with pentapeptide repeats
MVDQSHLDILKQGVKAWNSWRERHPLLEPDLTEANLFRANLSGANLSGARLRYAHLEKADLTGADFTGADLTGADLSRAFLTKAYLALAHLGKAHLLGADLSRAFLMNADLTGADLGKAFLTKADLSFADLPSANLAGADLAGADLSVADLRYATFTKANLAGANLIESTLVETNLERATLEGCRIYGISAWGLKLEGAKQHNLNVSNYEEPAIMVDNLEVAQFIYLLLNNERIRQVIDTITSKVVLILGRFTPERKALLEAIRDALRRHNYLPVLFDFDKPTSRDLTETISTLAHMARFIIADLTEAKSIPQELQAIVPNLPSVPVQPLLLASDYEYGMFEHFKRYPWVLEVYRYDDPHEALTSLEAQVISPAEAKARELSS